MNPHLIRSAYESPAASLYLGDCLHVLPYLEEGGCDALITDPPYCSGGNLASQRGRSTSAKYVHSGTKLQRPDFVGDTRDPRSFLAWCTMWLSYAQRAVRPGGYGMVFADWRQVPMLTDAFQAAGWNWRGLIACDKGRGSRAPHKGYFRHQCEFVVWGTNGPCASDVEIGPIDGCLPMKVLRKDKHHQTGKPTETMRQLVGRVPPGGLVLDPFNGSGSTGVACLELGRRYIGVELTQDYYDVSIKRLTAAERGERLKSAA